MSRRTDKADEMINDQIRRELRNLDSICTDEDEKPAIIQRIAALRATLVDNPAEPQPEPQRPGSLREIGLDLASLLTRR